jgi:SsrA-binding protein
MLSHFAKELNYGLLRMIFVHFKAKANMKKSDIAKIVNIRNKQASFNYHFVENFVAGIVLFGTEIKSIRQGKVNLQDAYCTFVGKELVVLNMHISPYEKTAHYNHEAKRERKLLLKKKELQRLFKKGEEKGLTIVPVRLFINDKGLAKVEIALAQGKKLFDKREDIKKKDMEREMKRAAEY